MELFYRYRLIDGSANRERNPFPVCRLKNLARVSGRCEGRKKLSKNPRNEKITKENERQKKRGRERNDEKSVDRCAAVYESEDD